MTILVDALQALAKDLKNKKESELTLILKYHQLICREIIEKLESGRLSEYFGYEVEN